jgi:hypothetical protein
MQKLMSKKENNKDILKPRRLMTKRENNKDIIKKLNSLSLTQKKPIQWIFIPKKRVKYVEDSLVMKT